MDRQLLDASIDEPSIDPLVNAPSSDPFYARSNAHRFDNLTYEHWAADDNCKRPGRNNCVDRAGHDR